MFETCLESSLPQRLPEFGNTDSEIVNRQWMKGTNNTIQHNEPHSYHFSQISGFTDGPDGPICSSTFSPVREPKVKEVTNDSAYTLTPPAYPHVSGEVLPGPLNSPKPTLYRGSGSPQNPPTDDLRRSSDPRAPGSPTPLARQSGLQRNPLVDAIIATRRITSPNSRAAAIVYVYLFPLHSHHSSFVDNFLNEFPRCNC